MAYLGEFLAVNSAADSDKLDGKDSTFFETANPNIQLHIGSTSNPHSTTAAQVGADPSGTASTLMTNHLTALDPHSQYITEDEAAAAAPVQSVAGKTGVVSLVKGDVGLGNVDNTPDLNKPISTAVSTALGLKADLVDGLIPANQLPSYVDDVLEFANLAAFPTTGESGKIYLAIDTNKQYRWSGSVYVITGSDLALGETASTAYRGDRGKIAYEHSQVAHAPSDAEKNVQADWNQVDTGSDDYIKNKPTIPSITGLLNESSHDALDHTGLIGVLALGTTGTTACAGNDARLSDARTPTSHTTGSHSDWPAAVSMTEVGYLDGVTSSIQAQLNAKGDVTLSGTQTLTNKTLEAASLTNGYTEEVYNLTGTEINPANGSIQYKTLSGNTTFTEALADGQSVTLMLNPATYTTTWPTTTWIGSVASTAPTLVASVYNCITFFQFGGTLYGKYEGRV